MERHRAARLATPTWVEVGTSQPAATAGDVTTSSPPPNAASVLPKEGATAPSPFPFEMRNAATTYASSISTNMSAYKDLPGHHLLSIRNLIASSPDDSYSDTTNDINFFMDNLAAPEWDYSGGTYVCPGNSWDLRGCRQKPNKSLRNYVRRFSRQCTELPSVTNVEVVNTFLEAANFCKEVLTFEVVGFWPVYHAILGRPCFTKFMAIPNYTYLKMKMLGPKGVITVGSSFEHAYECDVE
ncbi:uncharacterized protein LOC120669085 [Panicum virgatum]|uniref:uncharacterized protein LOC120669085 n=1 Tax=Panicum virgatum TaxID=38727 RepID=UPI0019D58994|nr:uncharacterized protein LOC120669085 [Panicum virgatum]